ncbi:MAG: hypothetical protein D6812_10585 [Deltaproteobacteria bacterium]|nr:MAG: hypothetical protein D6812_10585 [Deltaproteobacteria bacterium]
MANFFEDNEDLQFYVEKGIDWAPLVRFAEYDFGEGASFEDVAEGVAFYRDILRMVGEFAAEEIAPRARLIDEVGVTFQDGEVIEPEALTEIFEQMRALGLHRMCLPREFDGMNCPVLLYQITAELFARADVSVMAHFGFHQGMAMAMLAYSLFEGTTTFERDPIRIARTRFEREIREIAEGKAWGSMDITEPDAGSDMAVLKCVGEMDEAGNWYVTGRKIFITSGHGKYHFVIARTEKARSGDPEDAFAGLEGLSLFLVPTYEEDAQGRKKWLATIEGVEKKLGHNGSATVSIRFEKTPAHLIGKRGEGFRLMLLLMNNARIGVGFESLGLCEAAWRLARDYAAQRSSMGKTIDRHEMIADYLEEMATEIQAIRALAIDAAWHEEVGRKLDLALRIQPPEDRRQRAELEREMKAHQRRARALTPLLKYYAAERAIEIARRAIQIHGGYGYMKDYGAEKLLRDAVVFPIYEGTSQIQALMAMKDTLGEVVKHPTRFLKEMLRARQRALTARNPLERRVARVQLTSLRAIQHLIARVLKLKVHDIRRLPATEWLSALRKNWNPKRDFAPALLHAERLTRLLSYRAICEVLLDQARRFPEREELLCRFLERVEPRVEEEFRTISTTGDRLLERLSVREREGKSDAA